METIRNKYHNTNLLKDYYAYQKDMVNRTFGEVKGFKTMRDVYKHLEELNKKKKRVEEGQLKKFKEECWFMCETISATISGCKGEKKAFKSLETLRGRNVVLKNVELEFEGHRTELDAVVLNKNGAVIVEVKNTGKDVVITSSGNLKRKLVEGGYRTDCNLGLKMNDKEYVLRRALSKSDYKDVPIQSVVVFTDSNIVVDNQNQFIRTCSLSELPHVVERMNRDGYYNYYKEEINNMAQTIEKARTGWTYNDNQKLERIKAHHEEIMAQLSKKTGMEIFVEKIKGWLGFDKKTAAAA